MISLPPALISSDLKEVFFSCELEKCKGACCVEGDAGAPLEEMEISWLEYYLYEIKPYMTTAGIEEVGQSGVFDFDSTGQFVTPLIHGKECAYVWFDNGIARCAIEEAFQQHKIPFPKPLSCHLYPVRISTTTAEEAVNYHKWHICNHALQKGHREKLHLYLFLKDALVRKYGRVWYNRLEKLIS